MKRLLAVACLLTLGAGALPLLAVAQSEQVTEFPLDSYPGFGRSSSSALRDETIALWEAYQRDVLMKSCMQTAGLQYWPDPAFPTEAAQEIARGLNVQDIVGSPDPEQLNTNYLNSLPTADQDKYYLTLVGESLASMQAATELVPPGADPDTFATGGCFGQASAAIPGVWTLKRSLESELADIRANSASVASGPYRAYAASADVDASTPDDLESDLATGNSGNGEVAPGVTDWRQAIRDRLLACSPVWAEAYRTAEWSQLRTLTLNHSNSLESSKAQYASALDLIRVDQDFLQYLGEESGRTQDATFSAGYFNECTNVIIGTADADSLTGGAGDDCIDGKGGNDSIFGNGGNDHVVGGPGNDSLHGGIGADVLEGNDGNDSLLGAVGDDSIDGGPGENTCLTDDDDSVIESC